MVGALLLYHSTKLKTKHVPKAHPVRVWNRVRFYCAYEFFNICPSWVDVGFWTSDQFGRKSAFLFPTTCREVVLKILATLGTIFS